MLNCDVSVRLFFLLYAGQSQARIIFVSTSTRTATANNTAVSKGTTDGFLWINNVIVVHKYNMKPATLNPFFACYLRYTKSEAGVVEEKYIYGKGFLRKHIIRL